MRTPGQTDLRRARHDSCILQPASRRNRELDEPGPQQVLGHAEDPAGRRAIIAEVLLHRLAPRLVVGVFSTALATARAIYGIPTATVGTDLLLERIAPYQNSNRVPLTIVDHLSRSGTGQLAPAEASRLQELIEAVAYCMQPLIASDLRPVAQNVLALVAGTPEMRYFKKRRLMKLALPGGLRPTRNPKTIARRLGGVGYRLGKHRFESSVLSRREKRR